MTTNSTRDGRAVPDPGTDDDARPDEVVPVAGGPDGDAPVASPAGVPWAALRTGALRWAGILLVVVVGAWVGAALAPSRPATVGPLSIDVRVVPSLDPGVRLLLPPAGRVDFDTHRAPVAVEGRVAEVDPDAAQALLSDPRGLAGLEAAAPEALRRATVEAALATAGCALAGALGLSLLVYRRRWVRTAQVAGSLVVVLVGTGVVAVGTFDADRLAQPRFTGLLSRAPYVAGQASGLVQRLESYRSGLADIVQGVTALYATSDALPVLPRDGGPVTTVLHVSDIHLNPLAFDLVDRLVDQFKVDVVVDTGDITTWGTEVEGRTLGRIGGVTVPYVFVRGNHDSRRTQAAVAQNKNAVVLDDDVVTVKGLVIAGIGDPSFTPDQGAELSAGDPPRVTATPAGPTTAASTPATPAGAASATVPSATVPSASATAADGQPSDDPQVRVGQRLADTVRSWQAVNPGDRVDLAMVHEPRSATPLLGTVPLVLAGHLHKRSVEVDPSGTRVMVEGSTGGAGITAGTVDRLAEGEPVPLSATILYFTRQPDGSSRLAAYDEVTVGGFGLASVSLQRTVVRADETPDGTPTGSPTGTPTGPPADRPSGTPAAAGRPSG